MIKKNIVIILFLIGTISSVNSQFIYFDSVGYTSPHIVCEEDTMEVFFVSDFPMFGDFHIDLPQGYEFGSLLYYGPCVGCGGTPITSNPDDIIIPGGGNLIPFANHSIRFTVLPSCGSNPENFKFWFTSATFGGSSVSDTLLTPIINLQQPYLVFQGTENTTAANSTIDLTRLAVTQKYRRCFKVDYTSLISSMDQVVIQVPNQNQYFDYFWVTPGVTSVTIADTVYYTFDAAFFATIGDNDGLFEPGESFTFCDSVEVKGNCSSQNSNVGLDYALTWGCGGNNCQYSIVPVEGRIALSPTIVDLDYRPDLEIIPSICDTCGTGMVKYGFQLKNNTLPILPTGGFLTNVDLDFGVVGFPFTIASSRDLDSRNHCFDSVKIGGITVPFVSNTQAPVHISGLTIPGTGLLDIDGDGFYDDLPAGDSIVIELFGTFYPETNDTSDLTYNISGGNVDGNPSLINAIRAAMDVEYYDECGGNFKEERTTAYYTLYNPGNSISQMPPDVYDKGVYRYEIEFTGSNNQYYQCDSMIQEFKMILPSDISIDTTSSNITKISNLHELLSDSIIGYTEVDGLNDFDTLYFWYNSKGPSGAFTDVNVWVDLRMDCDFTAGFCPIEDSVRTIWWQYRAYCYDSLSTIPCYETAKFRGRRLIRYHCDSIPPDGINLKSYYMERVSFGYTDSTLTTKADRNTVGVELSKAMAYDTVKIVLKGLVVDSTVDDIYARINYQRAYNTGSGTKSIMTFDTTRSKVIIYDASASIKDTFTLVPPISNFPTEWPERYIADDYYDLQLNLSAYDDSMAAIYPGYQFQGGLNSSPASWDSIIVEAYFVFHEDNYGMKYFLEPVAQMIEIPTDTATVCDQYGQIFEIDHPAVSFITALSSTLQSCKTSINTLEVQTAAYDHYGNEYRRKERIDTMVYTYDPSYFNPPDSVKFYYQEYDTNGSVLFTRNIHMGYTTSGNTITVPMELSSNLNVLPEAWYRAFLRFYQKPTCEIQDSVLSSQFGQSGEVTKLRWNFLNPWDSLLIIDSTFGTSGAVVNPVVVTPTPFNISSSPITVSTRADSVCWEVTYSNLSLNSIAHTWLDFKSDSMDVTSVVRIDSGLNIPLSIMNYGLFNEKWVQLDTINAYDYVTTRVCAQYTTCDYDSIVVTGGWNCTSFPIDPVQGYSPTNYTCSHNQQRFTIFMDELSAYLQLNMIGETAMPIDLCDSVVYEVELANIDLTSLNQLHFSAILPLSTSNISVRLGASKLKWPNDGSTPYSPIADPVVFADSLVWDLSGLLKSGFLENYEIPLDTNRAVVRVVFETNCSVRPTDQIKFNAQGIRGCNKVVPSVNLASLPIQIRGLANPYTRLTRVNIGLDTVNPCDTGTVVHAAFYNILTRPTRGSEVISVQIPAELDIIGSIYNLNQPTYLQSTIPTNTVVGETRYLEWNVAAGMPNASPFVDSLSFDFTVVEVIDLDCSVDTMAYITAEERYSITCVRDSTECIVIYPLTSDSTNFTVSKADLNLANLNASLDFCDDTLSVSVEISNTGAPIAQGILTNIYLLVDSNNNGLYDSTDIVFDTISYIDSLPTGFTDTIYHQVIATKYTQGEICNLILVIDTVSCICDTVSIVVPVSLEIGLDTLVLCENDSVMFNVCPGTGNYPSRVFSWYDSDLLGNQIYLSDTTILNPVFNPPNILVTTTYRFAIQVQRDSCMDEDTLTIIVHPQPDPFNIPNDTICEGDSVLITVVPPQSGITYNLYDSNYTWIDTLPYMFNGIVTNKFYVEAVDSSSGCGSIWDSLTIYVTPFLDPGLGDSVILCETGGIINLFDTLLGSPDTNGTWTDPLGFPFGSGHQANFDPLVHTGGNYTYTIVNPVCPDTSAVIFVTETNGTNAGTDSSISLCRNDGLEDLFLLLGNMPDTTGIWSGLSILDNGYLGTFDPANDLSGRYKYKVTKTGCQSDSSYVDVLVYPFEDPSIGIDREELCLALSDPKVNILGSFGGTFTGSNGLVIDPISGVIDLEASGRGVFEIYYTTNGPCPEIDTISVTITQYGDGCELWIPQFISPNGDGQNDYWVIPGIDEFPDNNVKIFNRWGNLLFSMDGYDNSWDGKTQSKTIYSSTERYLPSGTYFYIFTPNHPDHDPVTGYVYIRH